jgi:hypothetical protein
MFFEHQAEGLNGQVDIFLSFVSVEGEKVFSINLRFHLLDTFCLCNFLVELRKVKRRVEDLNLYA